MATAEVARSPMRIAPIAVIVAAVVAIAVVGGLATDTSSPWYLNLTLPSWQPPGWLFGPVWSMLYLLLALSAIIVWHRTTGELRRSLMRLYAANGAFNLAWTIIFFQAHTPLWAGIEIIVLWITIAMLMVRTWPVSRAASLMLLPYRLWVGFASALTWAIFGLN